MEYVYHELNLKKKYCDAKHREKYCMLLQES